MHLTPSMLERAYEYLRSTPPFNGWGLPDADAVEFRVTGWRKCFGCCEVDENDGGAPVISVSQFMCGKSGILMETMAHEMCHLHEFATASKLKTLPDHGPVFRRLAAAVCRQHGFDPVTF